MKKKTKIAIIIIFIILALFLSWDDARREKLEKKNSEKNDTIKQDYKYVILRD